MRISQKNVRKIARELAPFYAHFGWTWGDHPEPPTEDALAGLIRMLAKEVTGSRSSVTSGGIEVGRERGESGQWTDPYIAFVKTFPL